MQHMVDKAYTRWVAANVISGHLFHAGNHRANDSVPRGNCDNCSYTHTQAHLHRSAHCTCKVRTQSVD